MIEALALDVLLVLILLLLIPIGMYRGGLREVCSAAGVLLGLLIAQAWSDRWGGWVEDLTEIDGGVSRFSVAVGTIVLFGALVGYASAASFGSSPGPGGRLYGGFIALLTGIVFLGAVVGFVSQYLYDGVYPELIRRGYVSRALSSGFDWVLLLVAFAAFAATLFGMIVRERDTEEPVEPARDPGRPVRRPTVVPSTAAEPITMEPRVEQSPQPEGVQATAPIRIHEVRHWEEPSMQDLRSGWSRTWPSDVARSPSSPRHQDPGRGNSSNRSGTRGTPDERTIQDWLAEDNEQRRRNHPLRRPESDE
jgi:hypothetical protein